MTKPSGAFISDALTQTSNVTTQEGDGANGILDLLPKV